MIIYGWTPVHLNSFQPKSTACPTCEEQGSILFSAYSKHAHVFWIPFFPYGKSVVSQCQNCGQHLEEGQMSNALKKQADYIKDKNKPPFWQFSGLALVALLISFGVYANKQDAEDELRYLAAPQVGDVYSYQTEDYLYTTMRVAHIKSDTLFLNDNTYAVDQKSGVHKVDKESNYTTEMFIMMHSEIKDWYDSKIIFDIERD
ncbi:MAG: hypothetical protein SchgKO_19570 [Schleiferiaceae bacterium]